MKLPRSRQRTAGLTFLEALVIVFVLAALVAVFLPPLLSRRHYPRLNCTNNLKQVGLAFRIWSGDNNDQFPMAVPVSNGGAMESAANGDAARVFEVMSNELSTPKILFCPEDRAHFAATNFQNDFSAAKLSYFVGLDASTNRPQSVLCGDDNFELGGKPVKSGLQSISTNAMMFWSRARHHHAGNVALADGSVQNWTNPNLIDVVAQTGLATNRLAIP